MKSGTRIALLGGISLLGYAGLHGRLRRYEIAEHSMAPALIPGDYTVAQARQQQPQRGEIVIFRHPHRRGFELVKRVVGLPGETIVISHGHVHANDAILAEPWANGPTLPDGTWELRTDELFVLGDNRAASAGDSRSIGPIPVDAVRWKVVARYWPPGSIGRIGL